MNALPDDGLRPGLRAFGAPSTVRVALDMLVKEKLFILEDDIQVLVLLYQ